ncbi:NAD(P)/FAD-dependent oxidoreductase [Stella sp.]|uniref:dihydrolipoyl dehydrogenase family protein n=1 Tax=Stella sp. TaxID=2912054 RepID=UPI0035AF0287
MNGIEADLCVIGAGAAGLGVAAGAAQMGARTVLVERDRMGGDCLHTGCVPSKALLAAAARAATAGDAGRFGIDAGPVRVDFDRVRAHVRRTIDAIAPHDSEARFSGLGVTVLRADARFTGPAEVHAGDTVVRARRFVVATGSTPSVPDVPGLGQVPYLTNETVFDQPALPGHLVVMGGGPVGIEMAQAHRRLGSRVTLLERDRILARDDPELVAVVRDRLTAEGVTIREGVHISAATAVDGQVVVALADGGTPVTGSHLLVATGRQPTVSGLGLDAAGIVFTPAGITVDRHMRTSNRRVFALGDVVGGWQFTHMAGYQAGIVLRNALFRWPARLDGRAVPRVTYCDPELAAVGLSEAEARRSGAAVRVLRASFADNDRARAEGRPEGLVKVVTGRRGRILGAAIAGAHAGELIQPWVLAIGRGLGIGAMAAMVAPYPTLGEASRRAAGDWFAPTLFGPRVRRIVRLLGRLG